MILVSGSKNKPGCSAGDSVPKFSGNLEYNLEKKIHIGNMCNLYCLFSSSSPGLGSEPGGQSHSGLEAEGRLEGCVGGRSPPKNKVNTLVQVSELC